MTATLFSANGQETQQQGSKDQSPRRFWAGLNYTFAQTDMKLFSRTEHAIWQGLDYGIDTLTEEQISSINSIARFTSENNAICLEAGMILLQRPETRWQINGRVLFGIARTQYETIDRSQGQTDLRVVSPFSRITAGVEFEVGYFFNPHWGLVASPFFNYAWGTATNIEDLLDEPVLSLTETRKEKSATITSRVSLMASYRIRGFTFSAGPGFYLAYNNRTYTVDRTNPTTGSTFLNETSSVFFNSSFIDGAINLEWRVIPALDVNLYCGIGEDILIHPAIRFLF